jgi:uncharacterized delta-60 repeat protein
MGRFISVMCSVFFLLSTFAYTQPVTAETTLMARASGGAVPISPASFTSPGRVNTLFPLSDGRMLIGGSFITIGGQSAPRSLAILKSDGTLDTTFQVDSNLQVTEIYTAALQPDGKILIGGWFKKLPVSLTYSLLRLQANGALDDTFNTTSISISGQVFDILMEGEKIVVGGSFTSPTPNIARLNQNGTPDSTFNGVGVGPGGSVRDIARQSSGKYIIVGEFGLARLSASGALDTAFVPGGYRPSNRVAVLNDNSVVVGGENICANNLFAWYTADGATKPALSSPDPNSFESITALLPLPDGGFLIGGWDASGCVNGSPNQHVGQIWRYAANGAYRTLTSFGNESDVLALAIRSDGKVLLGGQGRPKATNEVGVFDGLALLDLANNSLEKVPTFHPLVGEEAQIYSLSRYADGKFLVAGDFSHVNGSPRFGIARLLPTGYLDPSFHPFEDKPGGWSYAALALSDGRAVVGFRDDGLYLIGLDGNRTDLSVYNNYDRVSALAIQSDHKVLVGSNFGSGVRRLKADFSGADAAFTVGDAYGAVTALAVQDNKIFVAGDFSAYNSVAVPGLVRLNNDGSMDTSFNPPAFLTDVLDPGSLYSVTPLLNGNVLVGGYFLTVAGAEHPALVRLQPNGALDPTFTSPAGIHTIKTIAVQGDGSIWIGGKDPTSFRNPLILHLDETGQTDSTYQSAFQGARSDGVVNAVLCDNDGMSWAGGKFSLIDGRPFYGLARYFPLGNQVYLPLVKR